MVNKLNFKHVLLFIILATLAISVVYFLLVRSKENSESEDIYKLEQTQINQQEKDYLLGKFDPKQRVDFVLIPKQYSTLNTNMYLRKEVLEAFLKMKDTASAEGVNLKISSATRNFEHQKNIWDKKWSGATLVDGKNLTQTLPDGIERFKKILEYSATPGTSRHHWGTDIDMNSVDPLYFDSVKGKSEYNWLVLNAQKFGFCQTFSKKDEKRPTGYNEEKWHWSYLPLSKQLTQKYKNLIKDEYIKGFLGDEYAPKLNLINDYVLGINPDCL